MIDLHVHTWRCRHAQGVAADYVGAAAARGVRTLAFTDHLPLPDSLSASIEGADGYAMPLAEIDDYVAEVILAVAERAAGMRGYRIVEQAPWLRHFTARFAPL